MQAAAEAQAPVREAGAVAVRVGGARPARLFAAAGPAGGFFRYRIPYVGARPRGRSAYGA